MLNFPMLIDVLTGYFNIPLALLGSPTSFSAALKQYVVSVNLVCSLRMGKIQTQPLALEYNHYIPLLQPVYILAGCTAYMQQDPISHSVGLYPVLTCCDEKAVFRAGSWELIPVAHVTASLLHIAALFAGEKIAPNKWKN